MKSENEFDNILDECLERILTGGETVEQCLERYPQWARELEPLLQASLFARQASSIEPRPEFRKRARYQMRAALQEMAEKRERRFSLFRWQPQWVTAVVAVLVLVVASGGTVAASGNSMPDELLYPVKLATERVRLTLTPSSLGKAELYLELADKRVAEIIAMASQGKAEHVEQVARRLNVYLAQAAGLVAAQNGEVGMVTAPPPTAVPEKAPSEKAVLPMPAPAAIPEETPPETAVMLAPAPLPAEAGVPSLTARGPEEPGPETGLAPTRPLPERAPEITARGPEEVKPRLQLTPTRPLPEKVPEITAREPERPAPDVMKVPPPPMPSIVEAEDGEKDKDERELAKLDRRTRLRMLMIRNAIRNSEVLRAALVKVPEEARPALLRAIAESDNAYERVLEILGERDK